MTPSVVSVYAVVRFPRALIDWVRDERKRKNRRQLSVVCLAGPTGPGSLTRSRRCVMTSRSLSTAFVSVALIVGAATAASAQAEKLGTVDFKTSCSAPAHAQVNRAVALLHSFSLDPAVKGFTEAAQTDPSCGIAYWGAAMAWMGNPLAGPPSARGLKEGGVAVERAKTAGAKTQRERDYIAAVELIYQDAEKVASQDAGHRLRQGHGAALRPLSGRPGGGDLLRLGAQHDAQPERQDLRQSAQGRRHPRKGLRRAAEPSWRRALPDPQLRLPAHCPEGAARGQALRRHRPVRAPRAAHALAHLHPRRRLAGLDRYEPRLGPLGARGAQAGHHGAPVVRRAARL